MKQMLKFLFKIHKYVGGFIAIFFLMWFVTGMILVYHPYPRISEKMINARMETIGNASLPDVTSIVARTDGKLEALSIRQFQGQTLFEVKAGKKKQTVVADTLQDQQVKSVTFATVEAEALKWCDAPVLRVDTLHEREQWVLYSRYDRAMPLYKFYFDDEQKTELFISGKDGSPQQVTSRKERFWAWIGAIPHKLYFPYIRKDVDRWKAWIVASGTICLVAALSGFLLGICLLVNRYRQKNRLEIPYKRGWKRWHYVSGLVFGVFLIWWAISGIFSMSRVPQWLVPTKAEFSFNKTRLWGKGMMPLEAYQLDYRKLQEFYPELKVVEWVRFADIPAYRVIEGENERYIDASGTEIVPMNVPKKTIEDGFRKIHGEDAKMTITLLESYDNYYLNFRRTMELPVYKVELDDEDHNLYYVNPRDGYIRYLNKNKIVDKWLFSAIHYLNIGWLVNRSALWTFCLWFLCIGCGFVCLTGVVLGVKSLCRNRQKRRKQS